MYSIIYSSSMPLVEEISNSIPIKLFSLVFGGPVIIWDRGGAGRPVLVWPGGPPQAEAWRSSPLVLVTADVLGYFV